VVRAGLRPGTLAARSALHHRHHAGGSADRRLQQVIALKVFKGEQLATVYFWRAVGWNKKGDYTKVIADATEAIRLQPSQAVYNLRGSAYFDKGEYDIAIADFDDALKLGPPSGIIFHNRGNAYQGCAPRSSRPRRTSRCRGRTHRSWARSIWRRSDRAMAPSL
jgi:tetratricopeptide (TPR) repeat protein